MAPSELNQGLHVGIEQLILQGAQEHVGLLWHEERLESAKSLPNRLRRLVLLPFF